MWYVRQICTIPLLEKILLKRFGVVRFQIVALCFFTVCGLLGEFDMGENFSLAYRRAPSTYSDMQKMSEVDEKIKMDEKFSMDENQVRKNLAGFSREDICYFAWLCAVRALPFMTAAGSFDYWKHTQDENKRQRHLLSVLKAIDIAFFATRTTTTLNVSSNTANARTAFYASRAAADAAYDAYAARNTDVNARSAFYVARAAGDATRAANTSSAIADANAYATAADATRAAAQQSIDLRPILLEDLEIIKTKKSKFQNDTAIYGQIWSNFQKALHDLGCQYWAEWYAQIFAKGFILDDKDRAEIEMRLNVPGEIMERGAADVARYVLELKEYGATRLNEARILILGNKGAGKTSLTRRLKDPSHTMPKNDESTEGVDVLDWTIPPEPNQPESGVNVHIWDFAGHVITHAAHRFFMSERCLYIMIIDGRTEGNSRTEYWLEQIRNHGGDSPVLVLINVRDKHHVDVPENTLRREFPSIVGFYPVDINAGGKVLDDFRQTVITILRENPLWKNTQIAAPVYKVKEALGQRFKQGNEFLDRAEFDKIAKESGIETEADRKQLLKDLHDLGICLCYDDADLCVFDTLVLNPSWISHGIYRLINWGSNNKKTVLSIADFHKMFTGKDAFKYVGKAGFLFSLMKAYQLAFFKNTQAIFVPLLFPTDRPKDSRLPEFNFGDRLRLDYCANQALPPYTVARLAVLHSQELDEQNSWRFGAVLHFGDTVALVEENDRARTITVLVRGSKQKEYLAHLRNTLNSIFDDYKHNRPELKYEVLLPSVGFDSEDKRLSVDDSTAFMQTESQIIEHAKRGRNLLTGNRYFPEIEPNETIWGYGLTIINGDVIMRDKNADHSKHINKSQTTIHDDHSTRDDHSTHDYSVHDDHSKHIDMSQIINISFQDCSINFQGELNALARRFRELGSPDDVELANELRGVASDLDESMKEIPADAKLGSSELVKVKESLRKNGLLDRLGGLYEDLNDENSELHKKAAKIRKGVEALQKIGTCYNDVAQWLCLPQIPRPLLGTFGKRNSSS